MSRPWISCNLAISADGKISSAGHRPSTWTSARDHQRLLDLRKPAQALMVGRGTLVTDCMTLTVPKSSSPPLRCIVSRHGDLAPDHPIFQHSGGDIHLLVTDTPRITASLPLKLHRMNLKAFVEMLKKEHQVHHLHCEGGGQLIRSLAELGAIDEIHLTYAGHHLLGGATAPTLTGLKQSFLAEAAGFELTDFEPSQETGECFLSYRRARKQIHK